MTRAALTNAAIEILIERGWAATTTVAVCDRAGLTRGALVHHYANLSSLLAHALESLYEDFRRPSGRRASTMAELLDGVWAAVGDRRFKAVIEAWSAAGNDPALAKELKPAISKWSAVLSPAEGQTSWLPNPGARAFFLAAREAMLGLALGRACNGGKPLAQEQMVLTWLRTEAADWDRAPRP